MGTECVWTLNNMPVFPKKEADIAALAEPLWHGLSANNLPLEAYLKIKNILL
jgi:hypothetical protein